MLDTAFTFQEHLRMILEKRIRIRTCIKVKNKLSQGWLVIYLLIIYLMQQWPVTRSKIIRYMFHTKHNFASIHSSKFEPHEMKEI